MASNPMGEVIRLVKGEADRLGDFLSGLDGDGWSKDSYCDGWMIGDVVGHLSVGSETWTNSINRAVNGDHNPPQGQSFLPAGERGSDVTAEAARTIYQQQGAQLLDRFKTGYARLAEVLDGLKPEDWDKLCFHRRGPMPVADYVEVRLQELTVHGWDIRWGVDPAAEMWPEPLEVMVGRVPRWVSNAFRPRVGPAGAGPVPVRGGGSRAGPRGLPGNPRGIPGGDRSPRRCQRHIPVRHRQLHPANFWTAGHCGVHCRRDAWRSKGPKTWPPTSPSGSRGFNGGGFYFFPGSWVEGRGLAWLGETASGNRVLIFGTLNKPESPENPMVPAKEAMPTVLHRQISPCPRFLDSRLRGNYG